jgi:c-di-GMP-binding flagellar brake protein YcgR
MDPLKQIKINGLVDIEILNDESEGQYHGTKIQDIILENNVLCVNWPTSQGRYLPARKNDKINVVLKTKDGVFFFNSKIDSRALEPYAQIRIVLPEKLIKKQRRTFFRLPMNILVKFIKVKEMNDLEKEYQERKKRGEDVDMAKFVPPVYTAVSVDLSGGGMSILSKMNLSYEEELEVSFELTNGKRFEYLGAKVRRIIDLGNKFNYGLEFTNIKNNEREHIISYLFEVQRTRAHSK